MIDQARDLIQALAETLTLNEQWIGRFHLLAEEADRIGNAAVARVLLDHIRYHRVKSIALRARIESLSRQYGLAHSVGD